MTAVTPETRLKQRAACIAQICLLIAIALPLLVTLDWLRGGGSTPEAYSSAPIARFAGWAVTLAPIAVMSLALLRLRRSFREFAGGDWFSVGHAARLGACGRLILLAALLWLIQPTLVTLALTFDAPPGERVLSVSIGTTPILAAIFGAILWGFGAIWQRAHLLATENAAFI